MPALVAPVGPFTFAMSATSRSVAAFCSTISFRSYSTTRNNLEFCSSQCKSQSAKLALQTNVSAAQPAIDSFLLRAHVLTVALVLLPGVVQRRVHFAQLLDGLLVGSVTERQHDYFL